MALVIAIKQVNKQSWSAGNNAGLTQIAYQVDKENNCYVTKLFSDMSSVAAKRTRIGCYMEDWAKSAPADKLDNVYWIQPDHWIIVSFYYAIQSRVATEH